jgi:cytochrome b6-f complex iron-sulfur subunit
MEGSSPRDFREQRRSCLRFLGRTIGGIGGGVLVLSSACSSSGNGAVSIPLADLPIGVRVRVLDGEHPVELLRTAGGVESRSLWCTHTGCEVRWIEAEEAYVCPCHDGRFDADGRVVAGPPPRALPAYPIRVNETEVVLGSPAGS